ncbi:MAG: uroporphyrinogen-III C-methyltransferase [Bacteroidetes bacterium]|nr:uroporphyrinogen-III C-methyltransferase [Bacteroidota bacterium]MDA1121175.1 uroporphyrinogen-III C-methyltransferase [Bacteroidota bacterium]
MPGKLILVGAGPGDPELISVKGLKAIQQADIILYDALVHPDLLENTGPDAEKIYVGKRGGYRSVKQQLINEMIVEHTLAGKNVVRLKGGDPFVFARGREEIDYASNFGIISEVIPGISSVNLAGYYGIPLTVRGINESFWVVTATTSSGELSADLTLAAQSSATVVILMGLRKIDQITELFSKFRSADTPAVIISRGSHLDGKVFFGKVGDISEKRGEAGSPSMIIIGKAISTHPDYDAIVNSLIEKESHDIG